MKKIRKSNEHEMIFEFLRGELGSNRFKEKLKDVLIKLDLNEDIIKKGNINNEEENQLRFKIMKTYRGYPDEGLFKNFPKIDEWYLMRLSVSDIDKIYYIDYDYWNELSNNTSKPLEAVKVIKSGKEIYNVSNKPFLDGVEFLKGNSFPPIILITCNDERYLIIEGNSRMTIYGFMPNQIEGSLAYVGYCSKDEMKKYDSRMLSGESLKSKKY